MKNKFIKWLLTIIHILCILLSIFAIYLGITTDTISMSENLVEEVFGCTPNDFFDTEFDVYDSTKDIHRFAYINSKGELVLFLTEEQKAATLNLPSLKAVKDIFDNPRIDQSENYGKITITAYDGEIMTKDLDSIFYNAGKIYLSRMLSGEKSPGFSVYINHVHHGIVEHFADWPDDVE